MLNSLLAGSLKNVHRNVNAEIHPLHCLSMNGSWQWWQSWSASSCWLCYSEFCGTLHAPINEVITKILWRAHFWRANPPQMARLHSCNKLQHTNPLPYPCPKKNNHVKLYGSVVCICLCQCLHVEQCWHHCETCQWKWYVQWTALLGYLFCFLSFPWTRCHLCSILFFEN